MKAKLGGLIVAGWLLLLGGCVIVPAYPGYAVGPAYVAPPVVVRGYWGYGRGWGYGYRHGGW